MHERVVGEPGQGGEQLLARCAAGAPRAGASSETAVCRPGPRSVPRRSPRRPDLAVAAAAPAAGAEATTTSSRSARLEEDREPAGSAADAVGLEPGVAHLRGYRRRSSATRQGRGSCAVRQADVAATVGHRRGVGEVVGHLPGEQHPARRTRRAARPQSRRACSSAGALEVTVDHGPEAAAYHHVQWSRPVNHALGVSSSDQPSVSVLDEEARRRAPAGGRGRCGGP